jgi:hypothetical protein
MGALLSLFGFDLSRVGAHRLDVDFTRHGRLSFVSVGYSGRGIQALFAGNSLNSFWGTRANTSEA